MKSVKMKSLFVTVLVFCSMSIVSTFAQEKGKPDVAELASKEAERLENLLHLEDWQAFYVDSTLVHDYQAMESEIRELSESKVSNTSLYQSVQDKWADHIEVTYRKIFTDEQWAAYLKQGAARAQKQRAKRRQATEAQGK